MELISGSVEDKGGDAHEEIISIADCPFFEDDLEPLFDSTDSKVFEDDLTNPFCDESWEKESEEVRIDS
ncbi:hypothetical protein J0J24_24105, partial [Vibrio vulnificus]|uniref:hypothetical protein n=1 Tax=Vibrio vulnificus TaxID=672 RepID=UPI0019D4E739